MRALASIVLGAVALAAAGSGAMAQPDAARAYCADPRHGSLAAAPPALLPLLRRTFGDGATATRDGSFVRCAGPVLKGCVIGANLQCGKADRRRALAGATAFCRDNPGADVVPMAATGHATIFDWSCKGRRAVAGRATVAVDGQGYIAGNWRDLR